MHLLHIALQATTGGNEAVMLHFMVQTRQLPLALQLLLQPAMKEMKAMREMKAMKVCALEELLAIGPQLVSRTLRSALPSHPLDLLGFSHTCFINTAYLLVPCTLNVLR